MKVLNKTEVRAFGFGGQGIITMAHLIGEAAILDGKEVIMTEEYSPYITGGWSRADLIISGEKIDYPMVTGVDYLITLSQEGLDTNMDLVSKGGKIFIEKSMVDSKDAKSNSIVGLNAKEIAESLGSSKITNIVMLGFFNKLSGIVSKESLIKAIKKRFPKYEKMNIDAMEAGYKEASLYV